MACMASIAPITSAAVAAMPASTTRWMMGSASSYFAQHRLARDLHAAESESSAARVPSRSA